MGLNFTPTNSNSGQSESSESYTENYSSLFPSDRLPRAQEPHGFTSVHRQDKHGTVPLHFSSENSSSIPEAGGDRTPESQSGQMSTSAQSARSTRDETDYQCTSYLPSSWLAAVGGAFVGGISNDASQSYKFDTCTAATPLNDTKLAYSKKASVFSVGCMIGGAVAVAVMGATLYNFYQLQHEADERRKMRREEKKSKTEKGPRQRVKVYDVKQCTTSTYDFVNDCGSEEEGTRTDFDRCGEGDPSANGFIHCDEDDEGDPASTTCLGWQHIRK